MDFIVNCRIVPVAKELILLINLIRIGAEMLIQGKVK